MKWNSADGTKNELGLIRRSGQTTRYISAISTNDIVDCLEANQEILMDVVRLLMSKMTPQQVAEVEPENYLSALDDARQQAEADSYRSRQAENEALDCVKRLTDERDAALMALRQVMRCTVKCDFCQGPIPEGGEGCPEICPSCIKNEAIEEKLRAKLRRIRNQLRHYMAVVDEARIVDRGEHPDRFEWLRIALKKLDKFEESEVSDNLKYNDAFQLLKTWVQLAREGAFGVGFESCENKCDCVVCETETALNGSDEGPAHSENKYSKCSICRGSGIVAGPGEYTAETCSACTYGMVSSVAQKTDDKYVTHKELKEILANERKQYSSIY